jgi:hypothetical protein
MLATIIAAINAGATAIPEVLALIHAVKTTLTSNDQAAVNEALALANKAADDAHDASQSFSG